MTTLARWTRGLAIATALAVSNAAAGAQIWTASLNGPNESPANNSTGIGSATFTLTGNSLRIQISFSNLLAGTTASHIHCCTAAPNTGTASVATQLPNFTGFPLSVTSGTYDNVFDLLNTASYNPAFVTNNGGTAQGARDRLILGLNSGSAYLNIHSTQFPGGEIRGFISVVPEPSEVLLMGTGLFGLVIIAARRKHGAR